VFAFPRDTSQQHRPATNGVAERAQRTVKEGTSCFLSQAGMQHDWWVEAAHCYCFLRNAWDPIPSGPHAGMTSYQARFGEDCPAKIVMFGQEVEYYPLDPLIKNKTPKYAEKTRKAVFMDYVQSVRTGGKWAKSYLVLDYEDIRNATTYKRLTLTPVRMSELIVPQHVDPNAPIIFPLVENIVRFPFEKRLTLSQQDADNRKRMLTSPVARSLDPAPIADVDDPITATDNDAHAPASAPAAASSSQARAEPADVARTDVPANATPEGSDQCPDLWELSNKQLIRYHYTPRLEMFSPENIPHDCPIPIK